MANILVDESFLSYFKEKIMIYVKCSFIWYKKYIFTFKFAPSNLHHQKGQYMSEIWLKMTWVGSFCWLKNCPWIGNNTYCTVTFLPSYIQWYCKIFNKTHQFSGFGPNSSWLCSKRKHVNIAHFSAQILPKIGSYPKYFTLNFLNVLIEPNI